MYLAIGLPECQAPVSNGLMYSVFKAVATAVFCPSFRNGTDAPKNLADPMAIVDVMESIFTHPETNYYVLATGDKHFIPVVRRLREHGKAVRLYYGDGDSLSAHLRDEVLLGQSGESPIDGISAFPGVVSLSDVVERRVLPVSIVNREAP